MKKLNWPGYGEVDRSSLGYHMLAPYIYPDLEAPIIAAKPAIMKIVADDAEFAMFGGYYAALKDISIFAARAFTPCELVTQGISYGVPVDTIAQDWHDAILPLVPFLPNAYWEVCNEPAVAYVHVLAQVVAKCIELAAASGFRVAAPSWSEGTPGLVRWGDPDDWAAYMPALQAIHNYGPGTALLSVHEYARWGSPDNNFLQPCRLTRINGVYEDIIDPAGLDIWTIVLEYGRDNPKWKQIPINAETYAAELADDGIQDVYDARVIGRTIYTLDYHPNWQACDIYGNCFNIVNNYIASRQPASYPPLPSPGGQPPPPPPPPSGTKTVIANGLYLREGPGTGYGKITIMPYGTVVEILGSDGDWYQVRVSRDFWHLATNTDYSAYSTWQQQPQELVGWCHGGYLA